MAEAGVGSPDLEVTPSQAAVAMGKGPPANVEVRETGSLLPAHTILPRGLVSALRRGAELPPPVRGLFYSFNLDRGTSRMG